MTSTTPDIESYWPTTFAADPDEETPLSILRGQAGLLGGHTGGRVTAAVRTGTSALNEVFHAIDLIVPSIGYSHGFIAVFEKPGTWPVHIDANDSTIEIKDAGDLKIQLRRLLSSEDTAKLIGRLMKLARQDGDEEDGDEEE